MNPLMNPIMKNVEEAARALHESAHCAAAIFVQTAIITASLERVDAWPTTKTSTEDRIMFEIAPAISAEKYPFPRESCIEDLRRAEVLLKTLPDFEGTKQRLSEQVRQYLAEHERGVFRLASELVEKRELSGSQVWKVFHDETLIPPEGFVRATGLLQCLPTQTPLSMRPLLERWFPPRSQPLWSMVQHAFERRDTMKLVVS